MLGLLTMKEFLAHFKSLRFQISFLLIVGIMTFSGLMFSIKYRQELEDFSQNRIENSDLLSEHAENLSTVAFSRQQVYTAPSPLELLAEGRRKLLPNSFKVNVFTLSYPEQKTRANYLLSRFNDLDWSFIIVYFLSFLALLLTYDAISGEREDGTLRLLMSYSVGRDKVLLAKFLGAFLIIIIPLALGILVDILILMVSGSVAFELSHWAKLLCVIGVSVVFLSLFLFIGLLVSTRSAHSVVSMISLLLIWTVLVIIIPSTGKIFATKFYRIPSRAIVDKEITEKRREIWSNRAGDPSPEKNPGRWDGDPFAPNVPYRSAMVNEMTSAGNKIYHEYIRKMLSQIRSARAFTMVSPAMLYQVTVENICNTGIARFERFFKDVNRYKDQLKQFVLDKDKRDKESPHLLNEWHSNCISQKPVDFNRIPKFKEKDVGLKEAIRESMLLILVLIFSNMLIFLLAYASFLRGDI